MSNTPKQFNFRSEHLSTTSSASTTTSSSTSGKTKDIKKNKSDNQKPSNKQFKGVAKSTQQQDSAVERKFHSESMKQSSSAFTYPSSSSSDSDCKKFICVLDFEAVFADDCKTNRNYDMEIIEFPSVLLKYENEKELVVVDQIQNYVKTRRIPKINQECTKLTGITQEMVDSGVSFEEALQKHNEWLTSHLGEKPSKDNVLMATCGDWDLKTMIPHQVYFEKNTINLVGSHFNQWCNVKDVFAKFYNLAKVNGMLTMLNALKLPLLGKHHSGIDDCKNIARVVCHMVKQGCHFDATAKLKVEHGKFSRTKNADVEYTNYDPTK